MSGKTVIAQALQTVEQKTSEDATAKQEAVENQPKTGRFSAEEQYKFYELSKKIAEEHQKNLYNTPFDGRKRNKKKAKAKNRRKQRKLTKSN